MKSSQTGSQTGSVQKDSMPVCALCEIPYLGRGNVCAPLGVAGDRCCYECNLSRVIPARMDSAERKRQPDAGDLHVRKRKKREEHDGFSDDDGEDCDGGCCASQESQVSDYVASERAADECAPGIDFEFPAVVHGLSSVKCAVKPPCSDTRNPLFYEDIYIGCDVTLSMKPDGQRGLLTVLANLPGMVKNHFFKSNVSEESAENERNARNNTHVHLFQFGDTARPFTDQPDFVSFNDDDLQATKERVLPQLEACNDRSTNISDAVLYASKKAKERFLSTQTTDEAAGIVRVGCVLLLTDGNANVGEPKAARIVNDADGVVSDCCRGHRLAFYAIGLGEGTNPFFLSELVRGGFWYHVASPHDPSGAFDATIGTMLSAVGVYSVTVKVTIERDGSLLTQQSTQSSANYGLTTVESCRARILDVAVPPGAIPGDVLVVDTTFGGPTQESFRSRIAVETSMADVRKEMALTSANLSVGLYTEAEDVARALEKLRASVSSGENLGDTSDGLVRSSAGSSAVQRHVRYFTYQLEKTFTFGSLANTMDYVPTMPSQWVVSSSGSHFV